MVLGAGCKTTRATSSTTSVTASCACRWTRPRAQQLADFLTRELGTDQLSGAETYMEDPLRVLLHLIMSLPEYQLG